MDRQRLLKAVNEHEGQRRVWAGLRALEMGWKQGRNKMHHRPTHCQSVV